MASVNTTTYPVPTNETSVERTETDLERTLKICHVFITVSVLPLNVVFNALLISVVCVVRRLHSVQNYLIAAIACFDMLYGLVITPLYALRFSDITIFTGNEYGCIGMYSLIIMITSGRAIFFQWLTFDRYIAIQYPFWYQKHVTYGNHKRYVAGFILANLIIAGSLPMLGVHDYREGQCNFHSIWPGLFRWIFNYSVEGLTVLIPSVLNILILIRVKMLKSKHNRLVHRSSHRSSSLGTPYVTVTEVPSIQVSMSIYFTYLVFYVPDFISSMLREYALKNYKEGPWEENTIYFYRITTIWELGFMGVINPLLMFYLKKDYRTALDKILVEPFWRWQELRYYKLGHAISTDYGSPRCSYTRLAMTVNSMENYMKSPTHPMNCNELSDLENTTSRVTFNVKKPIFANLESQVKAISQYVHDIPEKARHLFPESKQCDISDSKRCDNVSDTTQRSIPESGQSHTSAPATVGSTWSWSRSVLQGASRMTVRASPSASSNV